MLPAPSSVVPVSPRNERDVHVLRAFTTLREGESLQLIYDHEPRTLLSQLEEHFPDSFVLAQRRAGSAAWEVTVRKVEAVHADDPIARLFERCTFLASAKESTRRMLARNAFSRHVGRNKPVVLQGCAWPFLGVVKSGKVFAVLTSPEGREQILYESYPYEPFGEVMLFDGGDTIARFVPLSEASEIVLIPREDVLRAIAEDAQFRIELMSSCARRARMLTDLLCSHVSKPVIARIAVILSRYAGGVSALSLSQIAAACGTVKEVVARALTQLESRGAIRRENGKIHVIDVSKLAEFDVACSPSGRA